MQVKGTYNKNPLQCMISALRCQMHKQDHVLPHAEPPTPCLIKSLLETLCLLIVLLWKLIDALTLHASQTVSVVSLQCVRTKVPGLHFLQHIPACSYSEEEHEPVRSAVQNNQDRTWRTKQIYFIKVHEAVLTIQPERPLMYFSKSRFCTHLARKPNVYFSNSA